MQHTRDENYIPAKMQRTRDGNYARSAHRPMLKCNERETKVTPDQSLGRR